MYLLPAKKRKREMTPDGLKVSFVTGNDRRADVTCGEGDQDIKGQISQFTGLIAFALSHGTQKIRRMDPLRLSRRQDLAAIHEVDHEPPLDPRPGATQQFMHHDRRAPDDKRRSKDLRREPSGSKVFNVDRGIENGKLSYA